MTTLITPTISSTAPVPLLTAEEFVARYPHHRVELVRGVVKELPLPGFEHGRICARIVGLLFAYLQGKDIGQLVSHDSFIKVGSSPDIIRGPDAAYYSYERLPKGEVSEPIPSISPDLVVEVRSPSDTWTEMFTKVGEYLGAGVGVVLILDSETRTVSVYRPNTLQEILRAGDMLTVPEVLPGLTIPVGRLIK